MAKQSKISTKQPEKSDTEPDHGSDYIWGAAAIARELNCPRSKVYAMIADGQLAGAVKKFGHRSIAASRTALRRLITEDAE